MTTLAATRTVREIAIDFPSAVRIFEKLGIDYCCGGGKPLDEACAAADVPVYEVLASIEAAQRNRETDPELESLEAGSLSALIGHIVGRHHSYVRNELARLEPILDKVAGKHGERRPALKQLQRYFRLLRDDMISHMMKEEQMLFPYIINLETAVQKGLSAPFPAFGTVRNPIRMMEAEHDGAGELLRQARDVTENYSLPEDACATYHAVFNGLQEFEQDLHRHIHLENNILFPRATKLEEEAA